uniref:SCP domain-containing protein n=1 Tax=Callorhinchus milii TaxID=7868 RepID=A0A4W3GII0_CALMI
MSEDNKMSAIPLRSVAVSLFILLAFPTSIWPLSAEQKEHIVALHNQYRSSANYASNMRRMVRRRWDTRLEKMARKHAQKCIWESGINNYSTVGENMHLNKCNLNIEKAIQVWYKEIDNYAFDSMKCFNKKKCGHYRQVVWAKSERIGCSFKYCEEVNGLKAQYGNLLVCKYAPRGDLIGQKPYHLGTPCSQCPRELKCRDNLCSKYLFLLTFILN